MEKTEKATPKRRSEARKKGKVVHSKEVTNFAVLLAGCLFFFLAGSFLWERTYDILVSGISGVTKKDLTEEGFKAIVLNFSVKFLVAISPLLLIVSAFSIASNFIQKPFAITWDVIKIRFSRMDPTAGIKRLFSYRYLIEIFTAILKLSIIGAGIFLVISALKESILISSLMDFGNYVIFLFKIVLKLFVICTIIMAFLALGDYLYQKWQYEKDIMMTKQEVKDEIKELEGDPQVRSRIRTKQKAFARKRMLEAVKTADVVITNPTHIAVALLYDPKVMMAPTVVAKGADWLALKIKEVAEESGVLVVENVMLAHALYRSVEVGDLIPVELYHAVAEVLAYVYRVKGKRI